MFVLLGFGLLIMAALLLAASSGEIGEGVALIGILLVGSFVGMLALLKYDQDRNYQEKFGADAPKKFKWLRGAVPKWVRPVLLPGRRRWALVLAAFILFVVVVIYLALSGRLVMSVVAGSVQAPSPMLAAVTGLAQTPRTGADSPDKPAVVTAQAQEQVSSALASVVQTAVAADERPQQIRASIEAWGKAWVAGDADEYFSNYSAAFKPANGMTLKQWENLRRLRVRKGQDISVSMHQLVIKLTGPDQALAVFTQDYRAQGMRDTSTKTLILVRVNGQWKITSEVAAPVLPGKNA